LPKQFACQKLAVAAAIAVATDGLRWLAKKKNSSAREEWKAYAARATQYCRDIVSGKIRACKWVKLACQRHLDDLVRSRSKEFAYRFDAVRAGKVCAFIERFPHVKGRWAVGSQKLHLEPWQLFIVCSIFGWLHKESGLRRFWEAIIMVPRKNGKTVLAAGIGLYMFVGDGEPGAEVYTGASDKKQSKEVFGPAAKMAKRADGFKEWFGITIAKESMYILEEGSKFEMVIGNPGDGPSPHCFIHDEFHEQPTFAQYDTAHTGVMAREQSLQLIISTAGVDIESPCHELQEDLKRVLDGDLTNDHLFGIVYTVDDPEKWNTIQAVQEANPNFGVSVLAEKIEADLEAAIHRTNRQNAFKTKNLNIWVNAREAWMNMEKWRACADPSLSIEEFLHESCYEGCDLGARIDLTSRCKIFVRLGKDDGQKHYYLFATHYVPEDRANDGDHPHYEKWLQQGKIVGHKGPEIQLGFIEKDINEDLKKLNYARIAFDPHQALQMQQTLKLQLGQDEYQQDRVLDVPQRWQYLDPAMKEIEAAVFSKRLHHTGDPVLSWAIGNVVVKPDANDNIFPRKESTRMKIDPATALFTGFYPALAAVPLPAGAIEVW
jgi:phage terminase large subunit-like protein